MKLVCEACGRIEEAASVALEAGQVVLVCAECGHRHVLAAASEPGTVASEPKGPSPSAVDPVPAPEETPVPSPQPAPAASPLAAPLAVQATAGAAAADLPPVKCPKCFHRQVRADHCERCGLDLARPPSEDRWETVAEGQEQAYQEAIALWHALEQMPRSSDRHEAFLTHCAENQLLEVAVRRYRSRLADRPGEQPAQTFLTEAVRRMEVLALALLTGDRWAEDLGRTVATVRRILVAVAALLLILGLVLLFLLYRKQGSVIPSAL